MRETRRRTIRGGLATFAAPSQRTAATGALPWAVNLAEQNVFVVLALVACGVTQTRIVQNTIAPDGWYTLLAGRVIAKSGLPHHDTLAVLTHGRVWVDQQWLGQLSGYGLWRAGGWPLALPPSRA